MEQAVNTFEKGLQMDTNPMVQGNKTLSNALNATFVTMNGNEVILQNDMGNRRVDNAYLPSGYEPVGIKEHGGIIYLALYNPITNKGQIGSFPSPQQRSSQIIDQEISAGIEDGKFQTLIKLTDFPMHIGDNFLLAWNNNDNKLTNCEDITNAYNTIENKIYSPKNRLYTYSLGVINSQNQFIDITHTLKRYEKNEKNPNIYDDNVSELYKFNNGYFIRNIQQSQSEGLPSFPENINIYSYKLVGPLYLKIYVNHIQDFSYSIEDLGIDYVNKKLTFSIFGNITYNCPDGSVIIEEISSENGTINTNRPPGDDTYYTYENLEVKDSDIFGYDLFIEKQEIDQESNESIVLYKEETSNNESNESFSVSYNKESNTYNTIITKKYTITLDDDFSNIINYVIKVKAPKKINDQKWYIQELEDYGTIDLSLIGTDESYITQWRYKYNERTIDLIYSLLATPISGKQYSKVHISLIDVTDTNTSPKEYKLRDFLEQPYSSGKKHIQASLEDFVYTNEDNEEHISEQSLYKVKLYYEVDGESKTVQDRNIVESSEQSSEQSSYLRWILTTPLFNNYYDSVLDYGHTVEEGNVLSEKLIVDLSVSGEITSQKVGDLKVTIDGSPLKPDNDNNINYEYRSKQNYKIRYNKQYILNNPIYYPSYLSLLNPQVNIQNVSPDYTEGRIEVNYSKTNNEISTDITTIDKLTAKKGTELLSATNVFDNIQNCANILLDPSHVSHSGPIFDDTSNSKWYKYIFNYPSDTVDPMNNEGQYVYDQIEQGGHNTPNFGNWEWLVNVLGKMNTNISDGFIFCYLFINTPSSGHDLAYRNSHEEQEQSPDPTSAKTHARVWWRDYNGNWSILRGIFSKTNINKEILETIDKYNNIVYKAYNNCSDFPFYIPKNISEEDIQPFTENIKYTLNLQNNTELRQNSEGKKILNFNLPQNIISKDYYEINVTSSEEFQDDVHDIKEGRVNGVYLQNGSLRDSQGNKLGANNRNFYKYKNNSLVYGLGVEDRLSIYPYGNGDFNLIRCIPKRGNSYESINNWYPYLLGSDTWVHGGIEYREGNLTTIGWEEIAAER